MGLSTIQMPAKVYGVAPKTPFEQKVGHVLVGTLVHYLKRSSPIRCSTLNAVPLSKFCSWQRQAILSTINTLQQYGRLVCSPTVAKVT